MSNDMQKCTKCGVEKSLEKFRINKAYKTGHITWCKDCEKAYRDGRKLLMKAYNEKYKRNNTLKIKELYHRRYSKKRLDIIVINNNYYHANKLEISQKRKKLYLIYPEKLKGKRNVKNEREYQIKNKERLRIYLNEYRKINNKWHRLKSKIYAAKRRSLISKNNGIITIEYIENLKKKQKGKCYWCKCRLNKKIITIDHYIALNKGGMNDNSNIVLACKQCNSSKRDKDPELFAKKFGRLF